MAKGLFSVRAPHVWNERETISSNWKLLFIFISRMKANDSNWCASTYSNAREVTSTRWHNMTHTCELISSNNNVVFGTNVKRKMCQSVVWRSKMIIYRRNDKFVVFFVLFFILSSTLHSSCGKWQIVMIMIMQARVQRSHQTT